MENLEKWINDRLDNGYSPDEILQSLLKAGYSEDQARSSIQRVLSQKKSNQSSQSYSSQKFPKIIDQYKSLIYLLIILALILFFTGGYMYAMPGEISTQTSRLPKINVTREVHKSVSPGSRLGVLLKASSNEPLEVELYEKLPEGFTIMNSISSMSSKKLDDNVYLFNITKKPNIYGIGITYFVKVPSNAIPGEYQIEGWYVANGQKINIEPTKFNVV